MNECQNCGESVDSRWKFCLTCGTRMQVRTIAPVSKDAPLPAAPTPSAQPTSGATTTAQLQLQRREQQEYIPQPDYRRQEEYVPSDDDRRSDYDRAMDLDESSAGGHVGKRKFRFDWQLALGVVLALGGIAMIVYLVVVLIVPHG